MLVSNQPVVQKLKQVVRINDAYIGQFHGRTVLFGVPENHPRDYLNGQDIHSSEIVSVHEDRVETKNTVYMVKSWFARPLAN